MPGMKRIQILTALMAALFGGALMVATPARADTITVTVTADGIDSAPGNGACAGPLYLFEAGDYFVYVFAGYGDSASGENDKIREIINSIRIGGA